MRSVFPAPTEDNRLPSITLIYGRGTIFTGQRLASELLTKGLREKGWDVAVITPPLLERTADQNTIQKTTQLITMSLRLLRSWGQGCRALLRQRPIHLNLGQTKFALIRDGFPLLLPSTRSKNNVIVSLHGNEFMSWTADSLEVRLFRRIVRHVPLITVLGETQRQKLCEIGVPAADVVHIDNTCLVPSLSWAASLQKQQQEPPLRLLFLSNLIETKGYIYFVEAIHHLVGRVQHPIEAILCGQLITMSDNTRFPSQEAAESWINSQIEQINRSQFVRLTWIKGAYGAEKTQLMQQAHIFVLPSYYKTEAQPISILEALASGCAVITSKVGEIPATVSPETAVLLDTVSPESIASAITSLTDIEKRLAQVQAGTKLFQTRFAYPQHIDRWIDLLTTIRTGQK